MLRTSEFLGIGVQKGGTTTLYAWLSSHTDVFMPATKEVHYYSLHYNKGINWYAEQFRGARADQLTGEITPYYCFHPYAIARSEAEQSNRKYILLLRDPVERCLSQYFHSKRLGLENKTLMDAIQAEEDRLHGSDEILRGAAGRHKSHQEQSYVARSDYREQLVRLEPIKKAGRLLLIKSESLFEKPDECWQEVLDFLGLSRQALPDSAMIANAGQGEAKSVRPEIRKMLRQRLEPTYSFMRDEYGMEWT